MHVLQTENAFPSFVDRTHRINARCPNAAPSLDTVNYDLLHNHYCRVYEFGKLNALQAKYFLIQICINNDARVNRDVITRRLQNQSL